MKSVYTILLLLSFIFISCLSSKEIIRPHLILKVYDSETRLPVKNAKISVSNKVNINIQNDIFYSNDKGITNILALKYPLGNHHQLLSSVINSDFIFQIKGYQNDTLNYIKYFKLDKNSDRTKTYVSDSIFLKRKN